MVLAPSPLERRTVQVPDLRYSPNATRYHRKWRDSNSAGVPDTVGPDKLRYVVEKPVARPMRQGLEAKPAEMTTGFGRPLANSREDGDGLLAQQVDLPSTEEGKQPRW